MMHIKNILFIFKIYLSNHTRKVNKSVVIICIKSSLKNILFETNKENHFLFTIKLKLFTISSRKTI